MGWLEPVVGMRPLLVAAGLLGLPLIVLILRLPDPRRAT